MNSNLHGHIHELIGGSWDPLVTLDIPADDDVASASYYGSESVKYAAYMFAHSTQAYSKILWRAGYLECPEYISSTIISDDVEVVSGDASSAPLKNNLCSLSTPESECRCTCPSDILSNTTALTILNNVGLLKNIEFFDKNGNPIESFHDETNNKGSEIIPGYDLEESTAIYEEILWILCAPGYIGDMFQVS